MTNRTLPTGHPGASIRTSADGDKIRLELLGRLDAPGTTVVWDDAVNPIRKGRYAHVEANCAAITYMDGSGVALLLKLREEAALSGGKLELINLREEYQNLLNLTWDCELPQWVKTKERRGFAVLIGESTGEILDDLYEMVSFVGESSVIDRKSVV